MVEILIARQRWLLVDRDGPVAPEITFWKFHMAKTLVMDDIRFSILNWNENYEIKTVNVGFILVKYIMTD